ncbi:S41 family peptidase [Pseudoflavonifractor sp. MSJ-37]|uniref:S41 family peptidase n=1 Tax=Pseudoflavonifractor sp. MSJ-37 TaxID=2841531 RepID=UPI001C104A25|nr:S41 family peptidase [Pseudoflavonifractor sp. MSJ-37]MBU5435497.1 S-layer homology domain-containing protein [Pseudoflavonifractor sp. MSJ-37]
MHHRRPARLLSGILICSFLAFPAQALTLDQAKVLLEENYIDSIHQDVLDQPTLDALLEALGDRYTQYFTAEEYAQFLASMEDEELVGIGVVSQSTEEGLVVSRVLDGSPALAAGLQAGDVLTHVDGQSVVGMAPEAAVALIQGEEGTQVELRWLRDGHVRSAVLTRTKVVVPSTSTTLVDGHIGYLDCTTFGDDTYGHIQEGIAAYKPSVDHWIMDLRGNGGGLTDAAVKAASAFTGSGTIGYLRDSADQYTAFRASTDTLTIEPVIVLVDEHTASSSELFSAAIRDRNAGIVIGGRTYGKGVAQTLFDQRTEPDCFPDGDALKITTHRFFTSSGSTTDTIGVIPHLLVDDRQTENVAYLLCGGTPGAANTGYYRLDLKWRWYISKETASDPAYQTAFAELLSALPPTAKLWEGTGKGNDGWKSISPRTAAQECGVSYEDRSFDDTADSPYAQAIDLLASYGILSGVDGVSYRPEEGLSRAELSVLLAVALNCNVPSGDSAFSDVSMDSWYGPAVNALAKLGLVSGDGKGAFHPDDPVTHQELCSILARMARMLNMDFYDKARQIPADALSDAALSAWPGWVRSDLWLLTESQTGFFGNTISLLWDETDAIQPAASATRGEAAYLLYQVLEAADELPV